MLTNEQRAHDYAITVLPIAIDKAKEERLKLREDSDTELELPNIDSFQLYVDIFKGALSRLDS